MKRIVSIAMIVLMLLGNLENFQVRAETKSEIVLLEIISNETIYKTKDQTGKIDLKYNFLNPKTKLKSGKIYIQIAEDSDFYNNKIIENDGKEDNSKREISLDLNYKGQGNKLNLIFMYQREEVVVEKEEDGKEIEKTVTVDYKSYYTVNMKTGKEETYEPPTETPESSPNIVVDGENVIPEIEAGKTLELKIPVKNVGNYSLSNATTSVEFATSPFTLSSSGNLNKLPTIAVNGKGNIEFTIKADATAEKGKYPVKVIFYSKNNLSKTVETSLTFYVNVTKANTKPFVSVLKADYPSTLIPGQTFNLKLDLTNLGLLNAEDVRVSIKGYGKDAFTPGYSAEYRLIGTMRAVENKIIEFPINVSNTITTGTNTLTVVVDYKDDKGQTLSTDNPIYFNVSATRNKPILIVDDVKQDSSIIFAGTTFNLNIDLKNIGNANAKDVKVYLKGFKNDAFTPLEVNDYKYIETFENNSIKTFTFPLNVAKNIVSGMQELSLEVKYKDSNGNEYSESSAVYVINVKGEDGASAEKSTPKIIINRYGIDQEYIKAGNDFIFDFDFTNTHNQKNIKNVKITIMSEDGTFAVKQGSNTFYLEEITPKETLSRDIEFNVKADALSKSYPVTIIFEYEDEEGNPFSSKEIINLRVVEMSRAVVNEVMVPMDSFLNQSTYINFELYNMGKAPLNNVRITVEGDFQARTAMLYIGNIEAGRGDMYDMEIVPMVEGDARGELVISFEDSNGKVIQERKEFSSFVMGSYIDPGFPEGPFIPEPMPEPVKPLVNIWVLSIGEVALLLISMFVVKKICIKRYINKMDKGM